MEPVDRRSFLKRAGVTAAAVGAVATAPATILGAAGTAGATTREKVGSYLHEPQLTGDEARSAESVVAHVRNAGTGEIALYVGEREVTLVDRQIAARLTRAAR